MRQTYTLYDFKEFSNRKNPDIDRFILNELIPDSDEFCDDSIVIPEKVNNVEFEPRQHVINNILSFARAFNVIKLKNTENASVIIN